MRTGLLWICAVQRAHSRPPHASQATMTKPTKRMMKKARFLHDLKQAEKDAVASKSNGHEMLVRAATSPHLQHTRLVLSQTLTAPVRFAADRGVWQVRQGVHYPLRGLQD